MEKVKVSRELAEAIHTLINEHKYTRGALLNASKYQSFTAHASVNQKHISAILNVDYDILKRALKDGYEVDEQETTSHQLKAFYGTEIKILKGSYVGVVLPITWFSADAKRFRVGVDHYLNSSDIGDEWQFVDTRPTPKTPHVMSSFKPVAKQQQQSTTEELQAELDYELASLHDALEKGDTAEIERSKRRLAELHEELYPQVLEGF